MSYRDALARKGIQPLRIERTSRRGGGIVIGSTGAYRVKGRKGAFAGHSPEVEVL